MADSPAVETRDLRKVYGEQVAVKGLTLRVPQGEVFGFLGPNGAGKTTSMKMLLSLVTPTAGAATLLGAPIGNREALRQIGFLPEHFRFQDWLTAQEFLQLHGELYGMPRGALAHGAQELLEMVGLTAFRHRSLRTFSKGMLQRLGLAQALLNNPRLVFLDEPTSGLDPVGRRQVRDIIRQLRDRGTTVFLNSHLLGEIEVTCDRVAFISHGEVRRVMELSALTDGRRQVTIRATGVTDAICSGLTPWADDIRLDGEALTLHVQSENVLPDITRYLVAHQVNVRAILPARVSLEDIFIETVGRDGGL